MFAHCNDCGCPWVVTEEYRRMCLCCRRHHRTEVEGFVTFVITVVFPAALIYLVGLWAGCY